MFTKVTPHARRLLTGLVFYSGDVLFPSLPRPSAVLPASSRLPFAARQDVCFIQIAFIFACFVYFFFYPRGGGFADFPFRGVLDALFAVSI